MVDIIHPEHVLVKLFGPLNKPYASTRRTVEIKSENEANIIHIFLGWFMDCRCEAHADASCVYDPLSVSIRVVRLYPDTGDDPQVGEMLHTDLGKDLPSPQGPAARECVHHSVAIHKPVTGFFFKIFTANTNTSARKARTES